MCELQCVCISRPRAELAAAAGDPGWRHGRGHHLLQVGRAPGDAVRQELDRAGHPAAAARGGRGLQLGRYIYTIFNMQ